MVSEVLEIETPTVAKVQHSIDQVEHKSSSLFKM